jgi:hypothetical protein
MRIIGQQLPGPPQAFPGTQSAEYFPKKLLQLPVQTLSPALGIGNVYSIILAINLSKPLKNSADKAKKHPVGLIQRIADYVLVALDERLHFRSATYRLH